MLLYFFIQASSTIQPILLIVKSSEVLNNI